MGAPTTALASAPSASSSRLDSARVMSAMPAAPPRWLSLAAVLAASLAGCTRQAVDGAAGSRVTVDYWEKWSGFEADAMQAVVDDFNRSQDRIEHQRREGGQCLPVQVVDGGREHEDAQHYPTVWAGLHWNSMVATSPLVDSLA